MSRVEGHARDCSGNLTQAPFLRHHYGMGDSAAEIRRAAQETLDVWPKARAAVLFGSRARGNHPPDRDWDVAFITDGADDRMGATQRDLPFGRLDIGQCVNEIAVPERLVERKALCVGHVDRGIVADGRVLSGEWTRPGIEGQPFMET